MKNHQKLKICEKIENFQNFSGYCRPRLKSGFHTSVIILKQEIEFWMEVCDHISCDCQGNSDDVDNHITLPLPRSSQYPTSQDWSWRGFSPESPFLWPWVVHTPWSHGVLLVSGEQIRHNPQSYIGEAFLLPPRVERRRSSISEKRLSPFRLKLAYT